LKCNFSGHECVPRKEVIEKYINGKAYKKSKEWYSHDFSKYEPFIIPSIKHPKRLYCTITKKDLNKIPFQVERHWNGKKFQRLKTIREERDKKRADKEEEKKSFKENFNNPEFAEMMMDDISSSEDSAEKGKKVNEEDNDDDVEKVKDGQIAKILRKNNIKQKTKRKNIKKIDNDIDNFEYDPIVNQTDEDNKMVDQTNNNGNEKKNNNGANKKVIVGPNENQINKKSNKNIKSETVKEEPKKNSRKIKR
jgi:hypothetical protein